MIEKLGITPGPWTVHEIEAKVYAGDNPVCGMLWPTDARSVYETRRNAELIAAAPEMLEALIELYADWENVDYHVDWIKSIIVKATGKSWEEIKRLQEE